MQQLSVRDLTPNGLISLLCQVISLRSLAKQLKIPSNLQSNSNDFYLRERIKELKVVSAVVLR